MAHSPCSAPPAAEAVPFLDFPADDSGAQPHTIPPVECDAYEAFLDAFAKLISAPWPLIPAYAF